MDAGHCSQASQCAYRPRQRARRAGVLTAWATGLARSDAAEFASVISYLAGDAMLREHMNAGNTDRDFVEFMIWTFVSDFEAAFARLMAAAA